MTVRITVRDGLSSIQLELDDETTVDEVIETTADYWKKPQGAYVLRWGNALLRGDMRIDEVGFAEGEALELTVDPEGG